MEEKDNTGFVAEDGSIHNVEFGAQLEEGGALSVEDKIDFVTIAIENGVPLLQAKKMFK